jgi:hypothetical protein
MLEDVVSKPVYRVLADLTQEPRLQVALPLAIKDLLRLKLVETRGRRKDFEQRYGMDFDSFKQAWNEGRIANRYSYQVECDYREWETTVTDEERLSELSETLL